MRLLPLLVIPAVLVLSCGCGKQSPLVYVLESPQAMTLTPSASTSSVQQGETVVLHLERRTSGTWKQIPRDDLQPGQCWLYRPPPQREEEVADNVEWEVKPQNAVRFNTEFRMDHTRIATMMRKGSIELTPRSAVTCEKDRVVTGPSIRIQVS